MICCNLHLFLIRSKLYQNIEAKSLWKNYISHSKMLVRRIIFINNNSVIPNLSSYWFSPKIWASLFSLKGCFCIKKRRSSCHTYLLPIAHAWCMWQYDKYYYNVLYLLNINTSAIGLNDLRYRYQSSCTLNLLKVRYSRYLVLSRSEAFPNGFVSMSDIYTLVNIFKIYIRDAICLSKAYLALRPCYFFLGVVLQIHCIWHRFELFRPKFYQFWHLWSIQNIRAQEF